MTCPRCGTKTRSKTTICPTCGHRPRRIKWIAVPIALALIAFVSFLTNAYFTDSPRSSESLADKVDLNITEETVSADNAKGVDLEALEDSLYTIGTGSGFLISPQDVLTAAYNVAGITRVTLKQGGKTVNGTVVGRTDAIAVIRIEKVKAPPFSFSHAIVGSNESVLTLTPGDKFEGTLTFEEDSYKREFDLPTRAIGSPIVTASGRVLGIHLATKTLPVALFEQDVLSFLESDTPAPPPTTKRSAPAAELAPVAPITPVPKREDPVEPAPAPESEPTPAPEPETETAPETPEPTEPPAEEPTPVEEEPPAEPEQPAEEPETPPVTEQPAEPDVPVTEPAEPVEPEQPAAQDKEAEATAPVKKQDKPKATAKPDKKEKPPVAKEKPVTEETAEDEPTEDEESTPSE